MNCGTVETGRRFVAQMMSHIDCQAQGIGAYGYGALSDPASFTSIALTGLLTIFVALFGLRLLTGRSVDGRSLIDDIIRIGIVLTIATSWPAWRTVGYNLVLSAPAELATAIGGKSGLGSSQALVGRMQNVDDGIVALTVYGTGRNTGGTSRSDSIGDSFQGVAQADQEGFANGRIAFLAGTLGPLAIVKLGAGILLAIAPLMAGLLLFAGTRDLFVGWLRGLFATMLASMALTILFAVEIAILEPWLSDALAQRGAQILTPSAPTELEVITLAFALAGFAMLMLVAKLAFFTAMRLPPMITAVPREWRADGTGDRSAPLATSVLDPPSRAFVVAQAVAQVVRRDQRTFDHRRLTVGARSGEPAAATGVASGYAGTVVETPLTPVRSNRQSYRRTSAAAERRNRKS